MASVAVESIVVSPPADSVTDNQSTLSSAPTTTTDIVRPPNRVSSMYATATPKKPQEPLHPQESSQLTDWGQNFWVTLVDPLTQAQFYACPSTGQTTWDAPVGNFVLPPSGEGEWWELRDETRGGLPYYYHTKSGETTWTKPDGFVIPLGVIQNTSLGRKLSQSTRRHSQLLTGAQVPTTSNPPPSPSPHRNHSHHVRRSASHASPPSIISERSEETSASSKEHERSEDESRRKATAPSSYPNGSASPRSRSRSKSSGHLSASARSGPTAQSLTAAVELLASTQSGNAETPSSRDPNVLRRKRSRTPEGRRANGGMRIAVPSHTHPGSVPATPTRMPAAQDRFRSTPASPQTHHPQLAGKSPRRPIPAVPPSPSHGDGAGGFWRQRRNTSATAAHGERRPHIGRPVFDPDATSNMNPLQRNGRNGGKPIHVATKRLSTGEHPLLPADLMSEIQQFAQSEFAKRYFSTHREGIIFRRKVPVERMMMWQKASLTSPLLVLNKSLHRNAVRVFKVIQRIMGDRDRDRPVGVRHTESSSSLALSAAAVPSSSNDLLEEERWLLGEGLLHGEMRDEIYCQVIKQLSGNTNTESTFRGWQLMCVLLVTFPPSKNFEPYVRSFMQQRTAQSEGRVDVMAKYCLQRLAAIAKKGPRGKAPTIAEIESASDAAFNPSTFGVSLDAVFRLQARTYADLKVPVILPFLADGILALGGTKQEGIFRVPGDTDAISELRLRIDKGVYTLDGIDDPHVPASLLKLWLRELLDPLVPEELYNECVESSDDPVRVVAMVARLPTINRRVVLFVISFLQLFLDERVQQTTKMTSANLALVMAPNLLRCNSDSMSVVFTNAQYEQKFVHNLLLHLRCDQVDPDYTPEHGKGAVKTTTGRKSHQKSRRPKA